ESANATLGKRMLNIFEEAAAFRNPETNRGRTPNEIARILEASIDDISRERAELLAQTGAIHGYNEGAMQRYIEDGVPVQEWLTADDDLRCEWCFEMNGKRVAPGDNYFNVGDSLSVSKGTMNFSKFGVQHPPLHPRCRCCLIPIVDAGQLE